MLESIGALLHLVLAALGIATIADPSAAAVIAVAVATLTAIAFAARAVHQPSQLTSSRPCPSRSIDVSVLPTQSDPDAPGHARPRAPGGAAVAALAAA